MPFKHQTESYRTRKGIRYECDGDIINEADGDLKRQAIMRVAALRKSGLRAFFARQDGGWYRVFRAEVR
jgi:hypothetical protein